MNLIPSLLLTQTQLLYDALFTPTTWCGFSITQLLLFEKHAAGTKFKMSLYLK